VAPGTGWTLRKYLRSTRGRLVLVQLVVLAAAAGTAIVAVYDHVVRPLQENVSGSLYSQSQAIAGGLTLQDGKVVYPPGDLPVETPDQVAVAASVFTRDGLLVETPSQDMDLRSRAALANAVLNGRAGGLFDAVDRTGGPVRGSVDQVTVGPDSGTQVPAVILVSLSVAGVNATAQRLLIALYAGGLLVVMVGGLLAHLLVGRVLSPVGRIAEAARSISDQDLRRRVELPVPDDELGELVATFNQMLDRVEGGFLSLKQFTADASHELRSPLTLMRTEVEVALSRARTRADYERVLQSVQNEVEHLSRIADQLLLLARADAGALTTVRAEIDVADFIEELAARWIPYAEARGIELKVEAPYSGTVEADPDLLKRVIDNLIDNALRYTPSLASVSLSARREDGSWLFEVADMGPGIPADLRDRVFARFSRADTVRTRRGGGAGLGLALSAAVAKAHGGSLELVYRAGSGAVFQLRLPDNSPSPPSPRPAAPAEPEGTPSLPKP
jgi:heavy metal sensor kinase